MCAGAAALVVRAGAGSVARYEGVDVHMGRHHTVRGGVLLGPVEVPQDLMEGAVVHRPAGGAGVRLVARWVLRREVRGLRGGWGIRLRCGWVGRIRAAVRSGAIICSVAATPTPAVWGGRGHHGALGAHDELGGDGRVEVLVLVEAHAVPTGGAVKDLEGDPGELLRAVVELRHCVHALDDLPLDDRIPGEAGVEEHNLDPQAGGDERPLDPGDEFPRHLLSQDELHVGDAGSVASRDVELGLGYRGPVRVGASLSVSVEVSPPVTGGRSGPPATAVAVAMITAIRVTMTLAITSWRGLMTGAIVISPTPAAIVSVGFSPLTFISAVLISIPAPVFLLWMGELKMHPAPLDLDSLQVVHGSLTIGRSVILHEPVRLFQGDLCQGTIRRKDVEDFLLRDSFAGQVSNEDSRTLRKAVPSSL